MPNFVSPRGFLLLWVTFCTIVVVSILLIQYARVPVYAYGPAIAFEQGGREDGVAVAVMLPPEYKEDVHSGQEVLLRLDQADEPIVRRVSKFDSKDISPETAQQRYASTDAAASVVTQPVVVAVVPLGELPDGANATEYVGGVYAADIQVDSRTALSMLTEPVARLLGGLF